MKTLISAADVKNRALRGEKIIHAGEQHIITPAARDTAREMGIKLVFGEQPDPARQNSSLYRENSLESKGSHQPKPAGGLEAITSIVSKNTAHTGVDPELVERVVREVLAALGQNILPAGPVIEKSTSGLQLVRGETVVCEPFSTGNPGDRVFLKDLLPVEESPNMCAGFMEMDRSSFEWELKYDEYDYVIDGELEIVVDGEAYRGKPGDVFYIPRGTRIIFSSPGKVKFFYVTYPANWQEQP